jgi:hypothetical protein
MMVDYINSLSAQCNGEKFRLRSFTALAMIDEDVPPDSS